MEVLSLPNSKETGLVEVITTEANAAVVQRVLEEEQNGAKGRKRKYTHFTSEQSAKITKYAAECGNTATVRHFNTLEESTVRLFKKHYEAEFRSISPEQEISSHLPKKKRGRPLTLGAVDGKVQQYVRSLRRARTPVSARIVIAAGNHQGNRLHNAD